MLTEIDDIINCFEDIHSEDLLLASQIADEIWEMFIETYMDIEALESFKKANS